jgi:hypothetical protein
LLSVFCSTLSLTSLFHFMCVQWLPAYCVWIPLFSSHRNPERQNSLYFIHSKIRYYLYFISDQMHKSHTTENGRTIFKFSHLNIIGIFL